MLAGALLAVALAVPPVSAHPWHSQDPIARTHYGKLRGYAEDGTLIWKGVPYAAPPVGALRWKAPHRPAAWHGVRDATQPAEPCTQPVTTRRWIRTGKATGSEDCLYVDIYRPQHPAFQRVRLPVYVWIHGGSNNFGSALQYDGRNLADRANMVVVVVQYRLGPMGWFFHPALQSGGDPLTDSGNFGTLDHVRALRWVRSNIAAFGGDPHNVTIAGESAGAHNVMNMVVSPLGAGLFEHAVSESGGMTTDTPAEGLALARTTIERLIRAKEQVSADVAAQRRQEMEDNGTLEAYLRDTDAGTIIEAILQFGSMDTYDAVEDGTVIPEGGWIPAINSGHYNQVPIILGANEYESKPFMPLYGPTVKAFFGVPSGDYSWMDLMRVMDGDTKADGTPLTVDDVLPTQVDRDLYELTGYYGARNWRAKFVDTVAHRLAEQQDGVYTYLFKWGGPGSAPYPFSFVYGAGHSAEIPFFFGGDEGLFGYPFVPANEAGRKDLQHAMIGYIARFARSGNPNRFFAYPGWWNRWLAHSAEREWADLSCPPWRDRSYSCMPRWQGWSNDAGAPKQIIFDADYQRAQIAMGNEEITMEDVSAELAAALAGLPANQQAAARLFQFSQPW